MVIRYSWRRMPVLAAVMRTKNTESWRRDCRSSERGFRASRHDCESKRAARRGVPAFAQRPDSLYLFASGREQGIDASVAEIWRDRDRVRNDSGKQSSAIARTDERDRGADVGGDGRVLSGEVQRWQRSAAWRSAGSFTGKRRRRWRRNLGCERHANGKRSARRRNDSRY